MSDYYDPRPRLRLSRVVVVAGPIGCGAPAIARHVASRTGLPLTEVDRLIEHQAGRSLARLVFDEGRAQLAAKADEILGRLAHRSPRGLVVLDRAWPSAAMIELLRDETHLVHVRRPAHYLRARLDHEVRRSGDWILEGGKLPVDDDGAAKVLERPREPLLRVAHAVLEAEEDHAQRAAELLLGSFEPISGAESI